MADSVYGLKVFGLTAAGRRFCDDLSARYDVARYDVAIHFQDEAVPRHLPSEIALALFRVLQDATVNAAVHAQARDVWVSVRGTPAEVRLQIVDHGAGFGTQCTLPGDAVELLALRERLKLVNGESVLVSAPGEGTRVEAWVPLRLDAGVPLWLILTNAPQW